MLTLGQLNEQISVLRSKIAVTKGLVLYLKTHYMPSDGAQAEMHYTRSDHGRVPPEHIGAYLADLVEHLDAYQLELEKLESTPLVPKAEEKPVEQKPAEEPKKNEPEQANGHAPITPKNASNSRKEATSGAARTSQDQPPAAQPAAGRQAG